MRKKTTASISPPQSYKFLFSPQQTPIPKSMALLNFLLFPLLTTLLTTAPSGPSNDSGPSMYPLTCSDHPKSCNSYLYHISRGLTVDEIAHFYSVDKSQIKSIPRGAKQQDYLINVPCTCKNLNGTAYFYDTTYSVHSGDIFDDVTNTIYSGQALNVAEDGPWDAGKVVPIHLLCGCLEGDSQVVVTYTVQENDTLAGIANVLSAQLEGIENLNKGFKLSRNPQYIDIEWVLFVPMEKNGVRVTKRAKTWPIIIGVLLSVTILSTVTLAIILLRRKRTHQLTEEDPKDVPRSMSSKRSYSSQNQYNIEDIAAFESEKPVIFSLQDIEEAAADFSETRKIGEGGYGSVYFGILGEQEVAIKKMKSNKSKEFFAELKVLCKIHHINVVELLGYATGDDHLYLVYEYIQNGSLSDHLHDPLLQGHQPLSWTARAQIAVDAAKGIEYIHDHTKARYVHRDIKTTNILLDEGRRAKVADFGLAKLVERTGEEDFIATRLVGTPGYLPPESLRELHMTYKTDVFAFGVVLAELITGKRALIRDKKEPNKMKSLISFVNEIFRDDNPENALEAMIDNNLRSSCPMEEVYKVAEIAELCLSEDPTNRPEMREVVIALSQILASSTEWEGSLGGDSQVFSGILNGR